MGTIKPHRDRSRTPQARRASLAKKRDRQDRERLATAAERAYLRLIEGQVR